MPVSYLDQSPHALAFTAASSPSLEAPGRAAGTLRIEPMLTTLLDQFDYGVFILQRDSLGVVHVNRAGYRELRNGQRVELVDQRLQPCCPADAMPMNIALAGAQRGLRKLLTMGPDGQRLALALIPIDAPLPGMPALIAAVFGRQRICEQMSAQWFARVHGLTPSESNVLDQLCEGLDPRDIATANEVAMSTVRTQVNAIREKTGAASIRALLQRLAMLPPMVNVIGC